MWRFGIGLLLPALACADTGAALYLMEVPPHTVNQPGKYGPAGDVVLEAMRRAGLQTRLIVEPSPRAMAKVHRGKDLLIIPLARIPERERHYTWIAPVARFQRAFFSLSHAAQSFADARLHFYSIAVARDTAGYHLLLAQGFPRAQLVVVNQGPTALRMLLAGRVDAWYNPVLEARQLQQELGSPPLQTSVNLGSSDNYLACSRICDPQLVAKLSASLQQMQSDGSLQKITARYAAD